MIPRALLWATPTLLVIHNVEEALTAPRFLPRLAARAPLQLQPALAHVSYPVFVWALALVTLAAFLICLGAATRRSAGWQWLVATVQVVMAVNVLSHVATALAFRAYTPGIATALGLNLPYSVYFVRRGLREQWLPVRAWVATVPAAVVLHGPGLLVVFALAWAASRALAW